MLIPAVTYHLVTCVGIGLADRMTSDFNTHPNSVTLTDDPSQHPSVFARAFNSGDIAAVERVYEPAGVFVPAPGQSLTGVARAAANRRFLDVGLPIDVRLRHAYVADDIALLIVDWSIAGQGADGRPVHVEGTATDVARRGGDGLWRYVIDNPFGTAAS
jgi:ketosteroid isomerase-like protein